MTIESVDVFRVLNLCKEGKYEELADYLMQTVNSLVRSGAEFAALSANTPHIVFEQLQEKASVPLVSIIEAACDEAVRLNMKKLGLIGTIFTMTGDFYKKPFWKNDIEIIVPDQNEMEYIDRKISAELELGIVKEETRYGFQKIFERMKKDDHVEAVILGCTERPLLLNNEVTFTPCLDTMKIHIDALINQIIE